jgi:hypothetical protein
MSSDDERERSLVPVGEKPAEELAIGLVVRRDCRGDSPKSPDNSG